MTRRLAIDLSSLSLERDSRVILRDVNWQVAPGESWALLGPNGAGKSTLIRCITAYLWPSEGSARILGHTLGGYNVHALRRHIGLVSPAGVRVSPRLTARQVVLTGFFGTLGLFDLPTPRQLRHADQLIDELSLSHLSAQPFGLLSSGEQVRVLLARALATKPRLLLLDEPTAGLDLRARESVLATIDRLAHRPQAPTLVVVTHRPEELPSVVSHALLLAEGAVLASGPIARVLTSRNLSRAYACPVTVHRRHGRFFLSVHPKAWPSLLGARPHPPR